MRIRNYMETRSLTVIGLAGVPETSFRTGAIATTKCESLSAMAPGPIRRNASSLLLPPEN